MGNSFVVGKNPCPRCRRNGRDASGNNFTYYGNGQGGYCFSCGYTIPSDERKRELGITEENEEEYFEEVMTREKITEEENEKIKSYTNTDCKGWRGIRKDTNSFFGVRYSFDEETGEPVKQFVPTTIEGQLVGYRTRVFPKDFSHPIGQVGKEVDMVGEFRFQNHSRTCLIVGGETKLLTSYQMLRDDLVARGKGDFETVAVVCSTLGESGAHKQIQSRYAFFEKFTKIIICMDNDKAGKEAAEKIVKVLPKNRAWIMNMRHKDADIYIEKSDEKAFIQDFWASKKYVPNGITPSTDLKDKMKEFLSIPRISLPSFMHKLQKKLRGGIPQGCIVNILSASGTGKSTFVDAMTLHWAFNDSRLVGIASMEASEGEYGVNLLSSFSEFKMNLLETVEERLDFLASDEVEKNMEILFSNENGEPRFYLVDADVDNMKSKIEYLIISCGCKIIVIDPIQDVFDGLPEEEQARFMLWEKEWMKKGITFVNISHSRKSQQGQKANSIGADLNEEDMMGHSSIFKSGGINLIMMRNKEAEDSVERNTTICKMSKARGVGETGIVGSYYYDNNTHKLWDKDDWMQENGVKDF